MQFCVLVLALAAVIISGQTTGLGEEAHWPQWRGPLGTGVAPGGTPPVQWSEESNIRWKIPLPGLGHSTPIIWNDRVFLTTAQPFGPQQTPRRSGRPGAHDNLPVSQQHHFIALALHRQTGKILWQKTLHTALPAEGGHTTASLASASPVADGDHVFVFFGSHGLFCLDHDGNQIWKKHLGQMQTKHGHGEGASPVLYRDTLIVNWDHEGDSFLAAFDKSTGQQRWRNRRDEVTSWSTPIIVEHNGAAQVIVPGTSRVRGYDLQTGSVVWECGGLSANIVASPVSSGGIVIVGSSYEKRAMLAIRLEGARGDITSSGQVLWSRRRGTPYVPSPLLYDNALYFHAHYQNILTRLEADTGKEAPGPFRLPGIGNVYASAVGADGRVYVTGLEGTTLVFTRDASPKVLARNLLNDRFNASAAIVGRDLFLRGEKFLYCIAEPLKQQPGRPGQLR